MGLFDSLFGASDDESQKYLQQALDQYKNINVPTVAQEQVNNLPLETVQGVITPQQIQAVNQGATEYNNISLDPTTRQAQINALQSFQNIANSGGLDANAKLGIQQIINAANEQSRGAQGAIMNSAQAMGQGGGDFALTQRAIAAQNASNTAATQGLQQAAEAEANREQALSQMANIGGSVNASDYNQAAAKAASQNTINASNTATHNNVNATNVANNMSGQQFNVSNAQNVGNANTAAKQNQVYYNAALPQQQFNNEIAKANGANGIASAQSNAAMTAQTNQANAAGQLLKGATTLGASALMASKGGVVPCYAKGGEVHNHSICMKFGGMVPGEASIPGDSETNDTVPALLSPGEVVIPRSVPKDGNSMEAFVRNAPVAGTDKKIDLTGFTSGYKRGK